MKSHAILSHTADVRIEAWAPSPGECYEEAVAAMVEVFADVRQTSGGDDRAAVIGPGRPEELLVRLLEAVLVLVDAEGLVPRTTHVATGADGSLVATFTLVPVSDVAVVGPMAKGISYEDLEFMSADGGWQCRATIDV